MQISYLKYDNKRKDREYEGLLRDTAETHYYHDSRLTRKILKEKLLSNNKREMEQVKILIEQFKFDEAFKALKDMYNPANLPNSKIMHKLFLTAYLSGNTDALEKIVLLELSSPRDLLTSKYISDLYIYRALLILKNLDDSFPIKRKQIEKAIHYLEEAKLRENNLQGIINSSNISYYIIILALCIFDGEELGNVLGRKHILSFLSEKYFEKLSSLLLTFITFNSREIFRNYKLVDNLIKSDILFMYCYEEITFMIFSNQINYYLKPFYRIRAIQLVMDLDKSQGIIDYIDNMIICDNIEYEWETYKEVLKFKKRNDKHCIVSNCVTKIPIYLSKLHEYHTKS